MKSTGKRAAMDEKLEALAGKLKEKPATARQIRGMIGGKTTACVYGRLRALERRGFKVKRIETKGTAHVRGPKPVKFTVTGAAK